MSGSSLNPSPGRAPSGERGATEAERLVFLSYHKPNHAIAAALAEAFDRRRAEEGLDVALWFDADLAGGDRWPSIVESRLRAADIILFLVTDASVNATYMWHDELAIARERMRQGVRVIPLRFSNVSVPIYRDAETRHLHRLPDKTVGELGEAAWIEAVLDGVFNSIIASLRQHPAPSGMLVEAIAHARQLADELALSVSGVEHATFGNLSGGELAACVTGSSLALRLSDPRHMARDLEAWRRRLAPARVKLSRALPALSNQVRDFIHAVEELQTWASEEQPQSPLQGVQAPAFVSAEAEPLLLAQTQARIASTDQTLNALRANADTPVRALIEDLADHARPFLQEASLHLTMPSVDVSAIEENIAGFQVSQQSYAATKSLAGVNDNAALDDDLDRNTRALSGDIARLRKLAQGDESGDPAGLQSKIVTIADLLKRNLGLKVPRYQRPFTWSEREVVQLIEDMRRTMREDRLLYFLGQMMLVEQSSGAPELTDGQQRLVTLSMLFAAIRDRMLEGGDHVQSFLIGEEGRPRLHLRDGDAAFFRAFVLEPGHFHALVAHRSTGVASLDAMIEAARAIDDALAPLSQAEYAELANFISQRCQVNLVYATDNKLMLSVFENLNQRGARLSAADIIKSDLIENSEFSQDDANLAAKLWAIAETRLSREDFAKLLFLSPTLMGANALSTPHDTHGFRRAVEQACGIREFLFDRLPRFAEAAGELMSLGVDAKEHTDEVRRRLFLMHQLETWDWFPSAVAFLAERPDPQKVRDFFCALELFAFAGELMAIDFRTLAERYRRALRQLAVANADAALAEIRLRPEEIMKLAATLNRSRKRDRQRRLMLLRVEAALPGGALLSLADDISVEHILPKSASFVWARSFPDAAKRAELCDLLGNLTLVSTQQAQQTETKPYAEKLKVLFDRRWPALALTRDLEGIEAWTEDAIETRQERLVHALLHDWGIAQPQAPPADAAV